MRGLIRGRWHRSVTLAPTWAEDADRFRQGGFPGAVDVPALAAEPARFHLYVAWPCPFARRVILARAVLGLDEVLPMSVLHPWLGGEQGWNFAPDPAAEPYDGLTGDGVGEARYLHEVYSGAEPAFTGRVTVPVLWDRNAGTIVSNDSATIMRGLIEAFGGQDGRPDLAPEADRDAVERLSAFIREEVNAGAYRAGTASSQTEYERGADAFFDALDYLEDALCGRCFLLSERMTEPDLLLFTTLVRLDPAYAGVLYLTRARLNDYPALAGLVERMMADPVIALTVKEDQIRRHYFDDDGFVNRRQLPDRRFVIPQTGRRTRSG